MSDNVNFGEIINEVLTELGHTTDTVESTILTSVKLRINQAQSKVYFSDSYEWRKKRYYLSTKAPVETGTASVTKGSKSVTLSSAVVTDIFRTGYLLVGDRLIKIDPHTAVTSTTFSLVAEYSGETDSTASYKVVFPDSMLDPEIAGVVSVFLENDEIEVKHQDRLTIRETTPGEPREAAIIGRTDYDFYTTGTVTVTQGSKTVTGSGTTFTSDMEGMPFKTDEFSELYTIHKFVSTTEVTLRQAYGGNSGGGKSFKVAPEGTVLMRFLSVPDDIYFVEIEALRRPRKLVNNTDESDIPNHTPLVLGSIWLAVRNLENKPVSQKQQAEKVFKDSLRELKDTYKVIKNVMWVSEEEIRARSQGNRELFRPLDNKNIW